MSVSIDLLKSIPFMDAIGFDRTSRRAATGVSTDSRAIVRGNIFFALRGDRFNGHNFVSTVLERGASALVVEAEWAKMNGRMVATIPVPILIVGDSTTSLGVFARAHRREWGGPVIAVGGSNGKTTTKDMIASVLASKYHVLATEANFNNHIGVPQTLLRIDRRHDVAVVEMGTNHPGEIAALCAIAEPTHGIITNIAQEHLEHFGSLDGVAAEEGALFEWLGSVNGTAYVNADDSLVTSKAKRVKKRLTYGFRSSRTMFRGTSLQLDEQARPSFSIARKGKKPLDVSLRVVGHHTSWNALAAATVGLSMSVPAASVVKALGAFRPSSKRMQSTVKRGITILNDTYNANPDSMRAALETLSNVRSNGKRIAVLADMLELGDAATREHAALGKSMKRYGVDYLLAYGPLSRTTSEQSTARTTLYYDQKNVLAEYLLELLSPGDVVLIKGSRSMKMEDVVTFITESMDRAA